MDHHGIVAGIIDELKIVEIIDGQIEADNQEKASTGEAVKAMIINQNSRTPTIISDTSYLFWVF